jgi:hypothetical protein
MLIQNTFAVKNVLIIAMQKKLIFLLVLSCSLVLFGRGYQYLFWDTPIRALMWHQDWIEPLVNLFGVEWTTYASSPTVDKTLNLFSRLCGWMFLLASVLVWFYDRYQKWIAVFLKISFGLLLFIFLLEFKDNWYRIGYFIEHSIQLFAPLMLISVKQNGFTNKNNYWLQIVTALTFIGHGLYAIGYYSIPGEFIDMIYYTLKIDEPKAIMFLKYVGIADIVLGLYLLLPFAVMYKLQVVSTPLLVYLIVWGFFTALARIYTGLSMSITTDTFHQELYKFLFRIPHAMYPLVLLLLINTPRDKKKEHI